MPPAMCSVEHLARCEGRGVDFSVTGGDRPCGDAGDPDGEPCCLPVLAHRGPAGSHVTPWCKPGTGRLDRPACVGTQAVTHREEMNNVRQHHVSRGQSAAAGPVRQPSHLPTGWRKARAPRVHGRRQGFHRGHALFLPGDGRCRGPARLFVQGRHAGLRAHHRPAELAFPDYDGNGMFKSLGNVIVNPNVGLLFIAMHGRPRRLRVNGAATLCARTIRCSARRSGRS